MIRAFVSDFAWSIRVDLEQRKPFWWSVRVAFRYAGSLNRWRARQRDGWGPL